MKLRLAPFGDGVITLRSLEFDDLTTILGWRNRDDARIWFKTSDKLSFESHRAWYERYLQKDDDYFFLIEVAGAPVGQCAIYNIDHHTESAEIGRFLVAPGHSGNGYMTRSCKEIVQFGTKVLSITYLYLEVFERNTRAIKLYTGCGFNEESRSAGLIRMSFERRPVATRPAVTYHV
jgi:RimJ/RimL family protein N-acetyltransferase